MAAFFETVEKLWSRPFNPLLARHRFGMVGLGLVVDVVLLFKDIIGEAVYRTVKSLYTHTPFTLSTGGFDVIDAVLDHRFYVPAAVIIFLLYIAGNVTGWRALEAHERIEYFNTKNAFIERLLSTSPVGAFMTDAEGVVQYTNAKAHTILTQEEDEPVTGRKIEDIDLIANTILSETVKKLREAHVGTFQESVVFRKTPASPIQWFECTFSPVTMNSRRIGAIGWIHDVTPQKKKQEAVINSIILALTKAIDARDKGTHAHSLRVRNIALTLARYLNLPAERFPNLEYAALLHDIGKILLPEHILRGDAELTPEQKEMVFRLPEYSASFLDDIEDMEEVREIVYYQKEWFVPPRDKNTKFRPFPGIKTGENIPIESRIIAVADAYEAMTSEKKYRKKMPKEIALIEFKRSSGIRPTEDEINRLLAHYKEERQNDIGLDELLSHSRLERQFDYKIVRALERAVHDGKL